MAQLEHPPVINATFEEFYDPNRYLVGGFALFGRQRLMRYLDAKRADPVMLPSPDGLVPVAGRQLIAAELAHAMLIGDSDLTQAAGLGLSEFRLLEATQLAEFGAQRIVKGIHAAAQVLLEGDSELADLTAKRDPMQLLTHGALLAAMAHRGQFRASGWPYVYHPLDCAVISGIAARKEGEEFSTWQRYVLRLKQYGDMNHDAWEDAMPSKGEERGRSFLASSNGSERSDAITPLVHYLMLRSLGVEPEHSFVSARGNFMLTKSVGPEKKGRMNYDVYAKRLVRGERLPTRVWQLDTPMAGATKLVDIHHNERIDPKRVQAVDAAHEKERRQRLKIKRQQNNYGKVFRDIAGRIAHSDADPMILRIARNVRKVTPKDLDDVRGSARILALLRDNEKLLGAIDEGRQRLAEEDGEV